MKICDLHNDFLTALTAKETIDYLFQAKEIRVSKIISSVYTTEMKCEVFDRILFYQKLLNQTKIKPKTYLHIEDCGFIKTPAEAERLAQIKPFSVGLTWNEKNRIAGGALSNAGLTKFGRNIIKTFEKNNVLIDLAHLNKHSFYDVLKASQGKIFCSHTAFNDVCFHTRNLDKSQIAEIIKRNGIIGLAFVGQFLNEKGIAGFDDVFKHINYFLENFDENHICFGTDFNGTKNTPSGLNSYTDLENLYDYLNKRKIPKHVLNKIFYDNCDRFFK